MEYQYKSFDEYYNEAIIKPKEEERSRRNERIVGNIIKYTIIFAGSILLLKEIF